MIGAGRQLALKLNNEPAPEPWSIRHRRQPSKSLSFPRLIP